MFLGIDLGTSAIKLLVINDSNSVLAESNISLDLSRPHPLWSEQDPDEWWRALLKGIEELKSQTSLSDLKGIIRPNAWGRAFRQGRGGVASSDSLERWKIFKGVF
jgi:sugar (pentulose or hexulose) kinase